MLALIASTTSQSRRSPATWPLLSLTSLSPSTSTNARASCPFAVPRRQPAVVGGRGAVRGGQGAHPLGLRQQALELGRAPQRAVEPGQLAVSFLGCPVARGAGQVAAGCFLVAPAALAGDHLRVAHAAGGRRFTLRRCISHHCVDSASRSPGVAP